MRPVPSGYVDLQVNGYGGVDFTSPDLTLEQIHDVTRALAAVGVAAYCPTVITAPEEIYRRNFPLIARAMRDPQWGDALLGIHLEGPFFTLAAAGAHPQDALRDPDAEAFRRWNEWAEGRIVLFTLAPERPGAIPLIKALTTQGIVCSLGHHLAGTDTIRRAVQAGACCCTHLGNGVPLELHRHCNPVIDQLAEPDLQAMFIPDGQHVPLNLIRLMKSAKRINQLIAVSDCAPIAGLPPGTYRLWGEPVQLTAERGVRLRDSEVLAGSAWHLSDCVQWLRETRLFTEDELMDMGRHNPLRLLGLNA